MSTTLERVQKYAEDYHADAQTAWEQFKAEHDEAMLVRDVEEVVRFGIYLMGLWLRTVERWHVWVSEDSTRYDKSHHDLFREVESRMIQTSDAVIQAIDEVKRAGFDVDRELRFREHASEVAARANPLNKRTIAELRVLEKTAQQAETLQPIEHWGD